MNVTASPFGDDDPPKSPSTVRGGRGFCYHASNMSSFDVSLQHGKKVEREVLEIIQQKYPLAFGIDGMFKGYDLFVPEISAGVEVKSDRMSQETGNIVVEISFGGVPSALMTTIAKFWVIVTVEELIWITPSNLKDCIVETNPELRTFVGRGDSVAKEAYLIKHNTVVEYAERVTARGEVVE